MRTDVAALVLAMLLGACGRLEFERSDSAADPGMDAALDTGPSACATDADCGECERCSDGACVPTSDGAECEGGVCRLGACCTGCLGGSACEPGTDPTACGEAGASCVACAECEACDGGSCAPASDGSDCPDGVCVSGACCRPDCAGSECGDDGCGGSCGTCDVGRRCDGTTCMDTACATDADCLPCETCTAVGTCVPRTDGAVCPDGACFGGVCCAGCWDGKACRAGGAVTACGEGGATCQTCAACETCARGACGPVRDGVDCTGGVCRGGACCTGCWDGTSCQPGTSGAACGATGASCTSCGPLEVCTGGTCLPPPCVYRCTVDVVAGTEDCDGRVSGTLSGDQFVATIDMGGLTTLQWEMTVCDPTGWVAHITDSSTGNGGGGDAFTSSNDAEIHISLDDFLEVIGNQMDPMGPSRRIYTEMGYIPTSGCTTFTWVVRDEFFGETISGMAITDAYLLQIDPPIDTEGTPDALWYVGLDRTWGSAARVGTGVTDARFCLR